MLQLDAPDSERLIELLRRLTGDAVLKAVPIICFSMTASALTPSLASPSQATVTATLMAAKKAKGMTFADLEAAIGLDEVWIASLFYGQATASAEEAAKLASLLSLDPAITAALQDYPTKGSLDPVIPTDPLIYRFYEIMQVYGMPLKDVIQEKFGDGIMSAIDFTLDVDKVEDPKGDRVKITMCGKFLPYKKW
jgi:cyanate lyase